ncbi:uncharacterized protein [Antedon mediterranea]|uniref:uncharacterized protein n=1 Tax=Antedon mediterranea TaxID=105859 RepID=UPI003AF9941F
MFFSLVDCRYLNLDRQVVQTLGYCLLRSLQPRSNINKWQADHQATCERIQRMTLAAIFDFACNSDFKKDVLVEECPLFIEVLLKLLQNTRCKEVIRFSIFVIHQLSLHETLVEEIIGKNGLEVVASMMQCNYGDNIIQRLCLQILVIFINNLQQEKEKSKKGLQKIADSGMLMLTVTCLKSGDTELVYWAAALIHEFSIADFMHDEICETPFLINSLQKALQTGGEASVQLLVLRVICFLSAHNDKFKQLLINQTGLIEHIPTCLASGEKEVMHWSLDLVHGIAMTGRRALENLLNFTNDKIIESLISIIRTTDDTVQLRLLAETLGFFCSCESLHLRVVKAGALVGILKFSEMHDPDLVFWSAALLLNLAMTSDKVKLYILQAGGLHTLMELALGDYDNSQVTTMAAKTLVMMGYVEGALPIKVHCGVDIAKVCVVDKDFNLNSHGISVMMWDTLHSCQSIHQSFNLDTMSDDMTAIKIPCLEEAGPNAIGNLVFMIIKGEFGPRLLKDLKETLKFSEHTTVTGTLTSDLLSLPVDHMCVIVSILDDDKKLDVWHISKSCKEIDLQLKFPYERIVKNRVIRLVLDPELKLLLSLPLTCPISRASSLELVEIVARPDYYIDVLLQYQLIPHLSSPIWYCSKKGVDESQGEPVLVAHCLGALKLLVVLSVNDVYRKKMLLHDTVNAVASLLYELVSVWLKATLEGSLASTRPFSRSGHESNVPSSLYFCETRQDSLADSISIDSIQDALSTVSTSTPFRPVANVGGASTVENVGYGDSTMSELPGGFAQIEHADVYTSLTLHSIQFLVNLAAVQDKELFKVVQMMLIKTGAIHLIWALLLSRDNLKKSISLAICSTLSRLSTVELTHCDNCTVRLDLTTKTPALICSGNALDVRNDSWTFESILGNISVPSAGKHLPIGWYFEVELYSSGIVQIGWATRQCSLEPEKGMGVGDDTESYAFDGARCKIWSGPITEQMNNDYGKEWKESDVISCLIDKHGNVSYWLRGLNMGVAFKNIDLKRSFYPACSLSTNQQIAFNFGDKPFRYGNLMPPGYVAYREIISTPVTFSSRYHDVPGVSWWVPFQEEEEEEIDIDLEDETLIEGVNGGGEEMAIITNEEDHTFNEDCMYLMGGGGDRMVPKNDGGMKRLQPKMISDSTCDSPSPYFDSRIEIQPMKSVDDNTDLNQPIRHLDESPSLYYEVVVTADSPKSVAVGYSSIEGTDQVSGIYSVDGSLQLPDGTNIQFGCNGNITIGCGLQLPAGTIFFTVNGHSINKLFYFANEEVGVSPIVPITDTQLLDFNFGNRMFLYSPANSLEQRLSMAALLHDFQQGKIES